MRLRPLTVLAFLLIAVILGFKHSPEQAPSSLEASLTFLEYCEQEGLDCVESFEAGQGREVRYPLFWQSKESDTSSFEIAAGLRQPASHPPAK